MQNRGLFDFESEEENYYFVVGVRADAWDSNGKTLNILFLIFFIPFNEIRIKKHLNDSNVAFLQL